MMVLTTGSTRFPTYHSRSRAVHTTLDSPLPYTTTFIIIIPPSSSSSPWHHHHHLRHLCLSAATNEGAVGIITPKKSALVVYKPNSGCVRVGSQEEGCVIYLAAARAACGYKPKGAAGLFSSKRLRSHQGRVRLFVISPTMGAFVLMAAAIRSGSLLGLNSNKCGVRFGVISVNGVFVSRFDIGWGVFGLVVSH
ncbi:hypothetical protein Tco_1311461 [Tanacetum coccineum]